MPLTRRAFSIGLALVATTTRSNAQTAGFDRWVAGFRARARARGFSDRLLDAAFAGVRFNPQVVERDRNQIEFTKSIGEYLQTAASDARVDNGRAALRQHARTLSAIEQRYGVDAHVVAAVWGMETTYGTRRGDIPVIEALATLAHDGRRGAFFEEQLVAALRILAAGDVAPQNFNGSWAGAMGHTQFIPTSFQAYAVDFGGDGRRDIWSDDPTDALASTAAYLARFRFQRGRPWGVEVRLPRGFNYELAGRRVSQSVRDWGNLGVRAADGVAIPDHGAAGILAPSGARGVAIATYSNFRSIERYNPAEAYVWGVGHLGDRLRGAGPFVASWPAGDRLLARAERGELQQRLNAGGFNAGAVDGRIGAGTRAALRRWQATRGMEPDGVATFALLEMMRR